MEVVDTGRRVDKIEWYIMRRLRTMCEIKRKIVNNNEIKCEMWQKMDVCVGVSVSWCGYRRRCCRQDRSEMRQGRCGPWDEMGRCVFSM